MNKWILFSLVSGLSLAAFAAPSKEFSCKNLGGLPDSVFKFSNVSVGSGASQQDILFVEATRYFPEDAKDPKSRAVAYQTKGVGTSTVIDGHETVSVGTLRFEFDKDELHGCKK